MLYHCNYAMFLRNCQKKQIMPSSSSVSHSSSLIEVILDAEERSRAKDINLGYRGYPIYIRVSEVFVQFWTYKSLAKHWTQKKMKLENKKGSWIEG